MNVPPHDEGPAEGSAGRDPRRVSGAGAGPGDGTGRRPGWLALAAFTFAFAVFETVKHQGWTLAAAAAGAALPLLAARLPGRAVALSVRHPLPPVLVLAAATFLTDSQAQAAPWFTLGLTWLTTVAVLRSRR
ncbi:hypothetical protein ACPEIF_27775 [Streptomyces sp. NPDC012600]|uniref:hypothetical protein n=1 Tax=Streptomyces sp. NPDC012600 TaxID=3415005 RepID=UPI003C2C45A9